MPAAINTLQPIPDIWAAFYCRLSRDDNNEGDSNSIAHQKQILGKYGRDQGIEHYKFYVDDGYSGTNFNRPDFKRMMADVEAGHINMIVVKDMSRLGRDYLEVGMLTEIKFPEKGIHFIAINDGVDSEDQSCNDFTPFRNIMNEWVAKDTSRKTRAVFKAKGMSGKRLSTQAPYGYLKGEDGHLVVDEETAPVVQMIYELCAEGNGPSQIARILRERKINTPRTVDFFARAGQITMIPIHRLAGTPQQLREYWIRKSILGIPSISKQPGAPLRTSGQSITRQISKLFLNIPMRQSLMPTYGI